MELTQRPCGERKSTGIFWIDEMMQQLHADFRVADQHHAFDVEYRYGGYFNVVLAVIEMLKRHPPVVKTGFHIAAIDVQRRHQIPLSG